MENLDGHSTFMPDVVSKVDSRHPADAQFALDAIPAGQGGRETIRARIHSEKMRANRPCRERSVAL